MYKSVQAVQSLYCAKDSNLDPDGITPIVVRYDSTCNKGGHSSHYGVWV